jgi:PAS domain S-box-containing protein
MDEAPVGITMSDPTQEDNPLVYANEQFTTLTGYDGSEVLGRNCRFLQGEDTDPDRVAELQEAIDAEQPVQVELRNYRKDGTEFWNQVTITPVRTDAGGLTNFVGFPTGYYRSESTQAGPHTVVRNDVPAITRTRSGIDGKRLRTTVSSRNATGSRPSSKSRSARW